MRKKLQYQSRTALRSLVVVAPQTLQVAKCKFCKREYNIDIVDKSDKVYTSDHAGRFAPLISFECRGAEITDWIAKESFVAEGEKGTKFNISFEEGDWTDFDERSSESVMVSSVETKVEKTK
eukprot:TRINITY_DN2474_c0_g1_i4.p1 TRINITY_DN2474_c0_g1~~TRINITY_DN2474_c0_g1_i4.p1  ORF type:complete len:122 (+),score=30.11 TRINITY_DN2474_c0_g1_i4:179-544(+)